MHFSDFTPFWYYHNSRPYRQLLLKQKQQITEILLAICNEKYKFVMKKHIFKGKIEETLKTQGFNKKINKNQINSSKFAKNPIIRQLELVLVAEKRPKKSLLTCGEFWRVCHFLFDLLAGISPLCIFFSELSRGSPGFGHCRRCHWQIRLHLDLLRLSCVKNR